MSKAVKQKKVRFIDLFAGIGGLRLGFEQAFKEAGVDTICVMTSEIKKHALNVLQQNFSHDYFVGDITKVDNKDIPDFDFLLGGFPCQPFSSAGTRLGFVDTRGTLFFEIERILIEKRPWGFILENVEGLVKHDLQNKKDEIGKTLNTILKHLSNIGYHVSFKVLDAKNFGLPQSRKRIFIVGTLTNTIPLDNFPISKSNIGSILERGLPHINTKFTHQLLSHYSIKELLGKNIKDKRGGKDNIHSWDIELKGSVSKEQRELLNSLLKERRKKKWAEEFGITWMDGMPLTLAQIKTFFKSPTLKKLLDDLVKKGYLAFEHPKKQIVETTPTGKRTYRVEDKTLPKGYNIVAGKLSFEFNKILDPKDIAPTLVATDMEKLAVADGKGLRRISLREGLRLFGYPEDFVMEVKDRDGFDLLGNTVAVPVVRAISARLVPYFPSSKSKKVNYDKSIPVASL